MLLQETRMLVPELEVTGSPRSSGASETTKELITVVFTSVK